MTSFDHLRLASAPEPDRAEPIEPDVPGAELLDIVVTRARRRDPQAWAWAWARLYQPAELAPVDIDEAEPAPVEPQRRERSKPPAEPSPSPALSDGASATPPEQPDDPLAALDAKAQARWRAGDLDGAERLFKEILARDGRGRWAELAYAELFSLAQRHSDARREQLWRDYLVSFPNGRYADDARAGLCRRAQPAEHQACWTDYIKHHPDGTHVDDHDQP